jgi:hypothetical protein
MKPLIRQILVILTTLLTLTANGLANALPLNGLTTGEISDRFQVYFVPAGYVFSIWGLIYLGLIAFTVYQALPSQRNNPRLERVGGWVVLANLTNAAWIFLWHYEQFPLTLLVMLILLASLIMVYLRLETGRVSAPTAETWMARLPFSIYLGWITVATVANVTALLDFLNWDGFGLAPETWMVIILAAVLVISGLVNFSRRDVAYTAVILWALAGIGAKFPQAGIVTLATWVTFGLVALTLAGAYLRKQTSR